MSGEQLKRQTRRERNRCAFCGGEASRRGEHLFSGWLRKYVHDDQQTNRLSTKGRTRHTLGAALMESDTSLLKGGPVHTTTIPFVCTTCNNGWMSRLDKELIPIFERLACPGRVEIGEDDASTIGKWAMMKSMIGEWDHPETVSISQAERTAFMNAQKMPAVAMIWLGKSTGLSWRTRYRHHGVQAYPAAIAFIDGSLPYNTQATTLALNSIVLHVRTSMNSNLDLSIRTKAKRKLINIFPLGGSRVWPTDALSIKEIYNVADEIAVPPKYQFLS